MSVPPVRRKSGREALAAACRGPCTVGSCGLVVPSNMDRREHPREVVAGTVELVVEERSCGARLLDLSETGVRVHAEGSPGEWGELVLLRRAGATEDGVRCHIVRV